MPDEKIDFTDRTIARLPYAQAGQYRVRDASLKGFLLLIGKRSKTFMVQGEHWQRGRRMFSVRTKVGEFGELNSRDARAKAKELLTSIARGERPGVVPEDKAALTLRKAWERYCDSHMVRKGRNEHTIKTYRDHVERLFEDWLDKPLRELGENPELVMNRHDRITKKNGPYIANSSMRTLRAIYNHARRANRDLPSAAVGDASMAGSAAAVNGFLYNFLNERQIAELKALNEEKDRCGGYESTCTKAERDAIDTRYAALMADDKKNVALLKKVCADRGSAACGEMMAALATYNEFRKRRDMYQRTGLDYDPEGLSKAGIPLNAFDSLEERNGAIVKTGATLQKWYEAYRNDPTMTAEQRDGYIAQDILADTVAHNRSAAAVQGLLGIAGITATVVALPAVAGAAWGIKIGTVIVALFDVDQVITAAAQYDSGVATDTLLVKSFVAAGMSADDARKLQGLVNAGLVISGIGMAGYQAREGAVLSAEERAIVNQANRVINNTLEAGWSSTKSLTSTEKFMRPLIARNAGIRG